MTDSTTVMTNMGFDWGEVAVERCFEANGYKCVRIRHMRSGRFIDVQVSPAGHKIFAYGVKDGLKGYDPIGGKETFSDIYRKVTA